MESKKGWEDLAAANETSGDTAETAAEQYQQEAAKVSDLATQLSDSSSSSTKSTSANQDAIGANATYLEALSNSVGAGEGTAENTKGYTTSLDENTAVGAGITPACCRILLGKLRTQLQSSNQVDQSTMSAKDAADKYASTLASQRQKFVESATAAGFNAGEVKKLADRIFQMPSAKQIKILADTGRRKPKWTLGKAEQRPSGEHSHGQQHQRDAHAWRSNCDHAANGPLWTSTPTVGCARTTSRRSRLLVHGVCGQSQRRAAKRTSHLLPVSEPVRLLSGKPPAGGCRRSRTAGSTTGSRPYQPSPATVIYAPAASALSDAPADQVTFQFLSSGDPGRTRIARCSPTEPR